MRADGLPVLPADPLSEYRRLLEVWDAADRRHHEAQVAVMHGDDGAGGRKAVAEYAAAEAEADVVKFEQDAALHWLFGFRLAVQWYPVEVAKLLDRMREHRVEWDRVAKELERRRKNGG